jgi:hypothetical protein
MPRRCDRKPGTLCRPRLVRWHRREFQRSVGNPVEELARAEQDPLRIGLGPSGTAFNAALTWFSSQPQRYATIAVRSSMSHAAAIAAKTIG